MLEHYRSRYSDVPNLKFHGHIDTSKVLEVLRQSSILYFATHNTVVLEYGQSLNKVIDYMFSARPILASHSGFKTMINEARCGYFVPSNDPISLKNKITQLSNFLPKDLDEMGQRGQDWLVTNRNYKVLASQYISLFDPEFANYCSNSANSR